MIDWQTKLAWVGLVWKQLPKQDGLVHVQVRHTPAGASSFGVGATLQEALENAAVKMSIDWYSVTRKITETQWARIAHL